ncbi:MAG: gliding motility-associated C-terminal domain-containing protein, partial [Bacteroidota bacterium]
CGLPLTLALTANRPLTDAVWNNGQTGTIVNIDQTGTYDFTATDGYCSLSDTFSVQDLYEDFPLPWLTAIDTLTCSRNLPLQLPLPSPYAGEIQLNGQPTGSALTLPNAGTYELNLRIENCLESVPISVDTLDCAARIYLPNAFSPNNDGVNDRVFPQGVNFETLSLQVFDRWGNLVHQAIGPNADWNGCQGRQPVTIGTYLLVLNVRNSVDGTNMMISREIALIR